MGFVNYFALKFSPDFQNTEKFSSCSALINAVMKYLNHCRSGSELESVTCKFTKNCTLSQVSFEEFHYKRGTAIFKNSSRWLLPDTTLFWNYPEWLLLKDSCKDIFNLEIIEITFLTPTSC